MVADREEALENIKKIIVEGYELTAIDILKIKNNVNY